MIRHILWETDKLEAYLKSLGLYDVAPVVVQIFYGLATVVNLSLLGGSAALTFSSPSLGSTLLVFFSAVQKVLISSYGLLSIQYPFLFEIERGPLKYPDTIAKKVIPK